MSDTDLIITKQYEDLVKELANGHESLTREELDNTKRIIKRYIAHTIKVLDKHDLLVPSPLTYKLLIGFNDL